MNDTVQLSLTAAEFRMLVELVYLGSWMSEEGDLLAMPPRAAAENKIYAAAAGTNLVEFDDVAQMYLPSVDLEINMLETVQAYDEATFWEGLAERLGERDMRKKHTDAELDAMPDFDQVQLMATYEEYYEELFARRGFDVVHVVDTPSVKGNGRSV